MMKMSFKTLTFMLLALVMCPFAVSAQDFSQVPQLPVDSAVRIGKLPNGLTYYIRHNEYPKGQADFYIAQKVGSALEEDNQRGLAHFLEHMCFNGTTHFPGNNIIHWLETVGVKFGQNLNAYTGVDETVYNISNVPIARESVQDSCLLILHDWANDLTLDPKEIDKERGVIHQEWRRSMVGQMRILEKVLPKMYPGSRYGYRLPIGTMDVVDNFPPQALRDYYEKWYRPDQQAILVVGDIDVDRIEGKIKEMFSEIEMPANAAERTYEPVGDHKGTLYAIGHDPEQTNNIVQLFFLTEPLPAQLKNTEMNYVMDYVMHMITSMLNNRFNDISSKPDAPFAAAYAGYDGYFLAKTKDALTITGIAKDDNLEHVVGAIYRELLRAVRGGFTQSEYDRARDEYISYLDKTYNNRNTRENGSYIKEYVRSFIDGEPIPGVEKDVEISKRYASMLPVQAINEQLKELVTADNRVLLALLTEKEGQKYPTEESFAAVMGSVDNENIEAYVDEVKSEPLIPQLPKPGKITKTVDNKQWGATEWTLSNGAKVIVKKTKFKEDEILVYAGALGGYADMPDTYANSMIFMPVALNSCGLGTYTNSDLQKYLAGKQVNFEPSFSNYTREFEGSTTPKDLPTFMEILYMGFKDINFSPEEFQALQNTYSGILKNQEKNPQYIFQTKLNETLYNSPRRRSLSVDAVNGASREQIVEIAHKMTANAADYTFVFVGNVDENVLRPLVEQYIASLPGNPKKAVKKIDKYNPDLLIKEGSATDKYTAKMETPQTWVFISDMAKLPYTPKNRVLASIAGQILSKRLLDTVREDMGAVYSIGASGSLQRVGQNNAIIQSAFPMKPEMQDTVLTFIADEFENMTKNIKPEELNKVKEFMVKSYTENHEKNSPWLSAIAGYLQNGVDTFNGDVEVVNSITVDDVQKFMHDLNAQNNYRVVLLAPEQ